VLTRPIKDSEYRITGGSTPPLRFGKGNVATWRESGERHNCTPVSNNERRANARQENDNVFHCAHGA
jgi:hypothetical protein